MPRLESQVVRECESTPTDESLRTGKSLVDEPAWQLSKIFSEQLFGLYGALVTAGGVAFVGPALSNLPSLAMGYAENRLKHPEESCSDTAVRTITQTIVSSLSSKNPVAAGLLGVSTLAGVLDQQNATASGFVGRTNETKVVHKYGEMDSVNHILIYGTDDDMLPPLAFGPGPLYAASLPAKGVAYAADNAADLAVSFKHKLSGSFDTLAVPASFIESMGSLAMLSSPFGQPAANYAKSLLLQCYPCWKDPEKNDWSEILHSEHVRAITNDKNFQNLAPEEQDEKVQKAFGTFFRSYRFEFKIKNGLEYSLFQTVEGIDHPHSSLLISDEQLKQQFGAGSTLQQDNFTAITSQLLEKMQHDGPLASASHQFDQGKLGQLDGRLTKKQLAGFLGEKAQFGHDMLHLNLDDSARDHVIDGIVRDQPCDKEDESFNEEGFGMEQANLRRILEKRHQEVVEQHDVAKKVRTAANFHRLIGGETELSEREKISALKKNEATKAFFENTVQYVHLYLQAKAQSQLEKFQQEETIRNYQRCLNQMQLQLDLSEFSARHTSYGEIESQIYRQLQQAVLSHGNIHRIEEESRKYLASLDGLYSSKEFWGYWEEKYKGEYKNLVWIYQQDLAALGKIKPSIINSPIAQLGLGLICKGNPLLAAFFGIGGCLFNSAKEKKRQKQQKRLNKTEAELGRVQPLYQNSSDHAFQSQTALHQAQWVLIHDNGLFSFKPNDRMTELKKSVAEYGKDIEKKKMEREKLEEAKNVRRSYEKYHDDRGKPKQAVPHRNAADQLEQEIKQLDQEIENLEANYEEATKASEGLSATVYQRQKYYDFIKAITLDWSVKDEAILMTFFEITADFDSRLAMVNMSLYAAKNLSDSAARSLESLGLIDHENGELVRRHLETFQQVSQILTSTISFAFKVKNFNWIDHPPKGEDVSKNDDSVEFDFEWLKQMAIKFSQSLTHTYGPDSSMILPKLVIFCSMLYPIAGIVIQILDGAAHLVGKALPDPLVTQISLIAENLKQDVIYEIRNVAKKLSVKLDQKFDEFDENLSELSRMVSDIQTDINKFAYGAWLDRRDMSARALYRHIDGAVDSRLILLTSDEELTDQRLRVFSDAHSKALEERVTRFQYSASAAKESLVCVAEDPHYFLAQLVESSVPPQAGMPNFKIWFHNASLFCRELVGYNILLFQSHFDQEQMDKAVLLQEVEVLSARYSHIPVLIRLNQRRYERQLPGGLNASIRDNTQRFIFYGSKSSFEEGSGRSQPSQLSWELTDLDSALLPDLSKEFNGAQPSILSKFDEKILIIYAEVLRTNAHFQSAQGVVLQKGILLNENLRKVRDTATKIQACFSGNIASHDGNNYSKLLDAAVLNLHKLLHGFRQAFQETHLLAPSESKIPPHSQQGVVVPYAVDDFRSEKHSLNSKNIIKAFGESLWKLAWYSYNPQLLELERQESVHEVECCTMSPSLKSNDSPVGIIFKQIEWFLISYGGLLDHLNKYKVEMVHWSSAKFYATAKDKSMQFLPVGSSRWVVISPIGGDEGGYFPVILPASYIEELGRLPKVQLLRQVSQSSLVGDAKIEFRYSWHFNKVNGVYEFVLNLLNVSDNIIFLKCKVFVCDALTVDAWKVSDFKTREDVSCSYKSNMNFAILAMLYGSSFHDIPGPGSNYASTYVTVHSCWKKFPGLFYVLSAQKIATLSYYSTLGEVISINEKASLQLYYNIAAFNELRLRFATVKKEFYEGCKREFYKDCGKNLSVGDRALCSDGDEIKILTIVYENVYFNLLAVIRSRFSFSMRAIIKFMDDKLGYMHPSVFIKFLQLENDTHTSYFASMSEEVRVTKAKLVYFLDSENDSGISPLGFQGEMLALCDRLNGFASAMLGFTGASPRGQSDEQEIREAYLQLAQLPLNFEPKDRDNDISSEVVDNNSPPLELFSVSLLEISENVDSSAIIEKSNVEQSLFLQYKQLMKEVVQSKITSTVQLKESTPRKDKVAELKRKLMSDVTVSSWINNAHDVRGYTLGHIAAELGALDLLDMLGSIDGFNFVTDIYCHVNQPEFLVFQKSRYLNLKKENLIQTKSPGIKSLGIISLAFSNLANDSGKQGFLILLLGRNNIRIVREKAPRHNYMDELTRHIKELISRKSDCLLQYFNYQLSKQGRSRQEFDHIVENELNHILESKKLDGSQVKDLKAIQRAKDRQIRGVDSSHDNLESALDALKKFRKLNKYLNIAVNDTAAKRQEEGSEPIGSVVLTWRDACNSQRLALKYLGREFFNLDFLKHPRGDLESFIIVFRTFLQYKSVVDDFDKTSAILKQHYISMLGSNELRLRCLASCVLINIIFAVWPSKSKLIETLSVKYGADTLRLMPAVFFITSNCLVGLSSNNLSYLKPFFSLTLRDISSLPLSNLSFSEIRDQYKLSTPPLHVRHIYDSLSKFILSGRCFEFTIQRFNFLYIYIEDMLGISPYSYSEQLLNLCTSLLAKLTAKFPETVFSVRGDLKEEVKSLYCRTPEVKSLYCRISEVENLYCRIPTGIFTQRIPGLLAAELSSVDVFFAHRRSVLLRCLIVLTRFDTELSSLIPGVTYAFDEVIQENMGYYGQLICNTEKVLGYHHILLRHLLINTKPSLTKEKFIKLLPSKKFSSQAVNVLAINEFISSLFQSIKDIELLYLYMQCLQSLFDKVELRQDEQVLESLFTESSGVYWKRQSSSIGPYEFSGRRVSFFGGHRYSFCDVVIEQMESQNIQFADDNPSATGVSIRNYLISCISKLDSKTGSHSDDPKFFMVIQKLNVIIALIDTRNLDLGNLYYFVNEQNQLQFTRDFTETPMSLKIMWMAYTGKDYLSVEASAVPCLTGDDDLDRRIANSRWPCVPSYIN